jgi:Copper binding periplasmic protein CusF
VTKIDRLNRTISIRATQPAQSGTLGATQQFKAQQGMSLDDVHAGDRVNYSVTGADRPATITKLDVIP